MKRLLFVILLFQYFSNLYACQNNYIYFENKSIVNCSDSIIKELSLIKDTKTQIEFIDCIGENLIQLCPWEGFGDIGISIFNLCLSKNDARLNETISLFFTKYYRMGWAEMYSEFSAKLLVYIESISFDTLDIQNKFKVYELISIMRSEIFKEDYNLYYRISDSLSSYMVNDYHDKLPINTALIISTYIQENRIDTSSLISLLDIYNSNKDKINIDIEIWINNNDWKQLSPIHKWRLFRFLRLFRSHKNKKETLIFYRDYKELL